MVTNIKSYRKVNFRSFLVVALTLLCAVFSAFIFTVSKPLGGILFAALLTFLVILAVIYKKRLDRVITFILAIVTSIVVFASFYNTQKNWINPSLDYTTKITVIGTVESDITIDATRRIYLKALSLNGEKTDGRLLVYATDSDKGLKEGDVITFTALIKPKLLLDELKIYGSTYRDDLHYTTSVQNEEITLLSHKPVGVLDKVRSFIKGRLTKGLGEEYGALSFGMLTGSKVYLTRQVKNYFSAAGLIHILAVSGMHLAVLTAIIMIIAKKLRLNRVATALIVIVFLFLYALIASFSPSISRAAIMSTIIMLAYLFGNRRDSLSSLSLAFCTIIIFAPFLMFEVGFCISFGCVFSFILFEKPLKKAFISIKLPKYFAELLAVTTSLQIGLLPAQIFFFNNFQLYGLIANLLFYPVIIVIFVLLFFCLILSALISPLIFLFKVPLVGLTAIDFFALRISMLPYSRIIVYALPTIFLMYVLFFFCSRFVMIKQKLPCVLLAVILAIFMIFTQSSTPVDKSSIASVDSGYSAISYVTDGKNGYLVGDIWSGYLTGKKLQALKVKNLTAIFVNQINYNVALQIQSINAHFSNFTLFYYAQDFADLSTIEKSKTTKELKNIKSVSFSLNENSEESNEEKTRLISLLGGFSSVFDGNYFCGFSYKNDKMPTKVCMFFPKSSYRYARLKNIEDYNIIRAYRYYDVGDKLYLIGEYLDDDFLETERQKGKKLYLMNYDKNIYSYKDFRFYNHSLAY